MTGCFSWLCRWKTAPTDTVAGVNELYQQLLPTKIYQQYKTKTSNNTDVKCRMCGKAMESVPHVLSGCSVLAQSKYKTRHDAALKVLFFDLLCDMGLIESAPSWCSPETAKPEYKNDRASAFWDVPVYAEKREVRANRIDARVVDKQKKKVLLLEMSCLWMATYELLDTIIMTRASLRILPLPIFPTLFFSGMPRCLRILVLGSGKSLDVSSDRVLIHDPASRKGSKRRVSARASSQEPRRAVLASLISAASSVPLRKRS